MKELDSGAPPGGSTEEYPRGTEEYSAQEEPPSPDTREGPAPARGEAMSGDERPEPDTQEYWEREGYESLQGYVDAGWEAIGWSNRPKPRLRELHGATPPAGKAPPPGKLPTRPLKIHQVNVKLTPSEYDTLTEAARRYAVATSTLAAVLVYRGAVAALAAGSD